MFLIQPKSKKLPITNAQQCHSLSVVIDITISTHKTEYIKLQLSGSNSLGMYVICNKINNKYIYDIWLLLIVFHSLH